MNKGETGGHAACRCQVKSLFNAKIFFFRKSGNKALVGDPDIENVTYHIISLEQ
jgi:hypothetical protein